MITVDPNDPQKGFRRFLNYPYWTIDECVQLLLANTPLEDPTSAEEYGYVRDYIFRQISDAAFSPELPGKHRNVENYEDKKFVSFVPSDFINWATRRKLPLPKPLVEAFSELQSEQAAAHPPKLEPHGNKIRFDQARIEVLKAAVSVMAYDPGACKSVAAVVRLINEKSLLFWKDRNEPPLSTPKMEELIRPAFRMLKEKKKK
ncbi:MAG: hypothetical protein U0136_07400 [Bdellovibrionota bacterium]